MEGQDAQSVMEQISSSKKRRIDYSYREELISLGFKPVDVSIYDRRIRAGEDPEIVKSDILQKIEKKKKEIAEYAFGRNKKKRYRIKIINKKRSGVAMNKTLGKIVRIANLLDSNGLHNEADKLTRVAVKLAQNFNDEYSKYEMRTQRDYDRSQEDGGIMGGDYSGLAALENDPLMKRYKMEYQKDPMAEGDEEIGNLVHGKLMEALSGTYLEDSVAHGDDLYIMESWLKDEMSLPQSAEEYEVGLREHFNDYGDDGYDPLDD
jgi:CRISPR/Cas system-associated protein endoribonuclease Cas2